MKDITQESEDTVVKKEKETKLLVQKAEVRRSRQSGLSAAWHTDLQTMTKKVLDTQVSFSVGEIIGASPSISAEL